MNQIGKEIDYAVRMQALVWGRRRAARNRLVGSEPWSSAPEGSVPVSQLSSVAGVGTAGTMVTPISFIIPDGFDTLLKEIVTSYTGTNFTPGSGQLIFCLRLDGLYFPSGYENIRFAIGDNQNGQKIFPAVVVKSGQLVEIFCEVAATFVPQANSRIIAGVTGLAYPTGIARTN